MTDTIDNKNIRTFIRDTIASLPLDNGIKHMVKESNIRIQGIIKNKKINEGVKFNDAIHLYVFGLCLVNQIVKQKDMTPYWDIFLKINTYLF